MDTSPAGPNPGSGPQPGAGPQWPRDARDLSAPDESGGGGGIDPDALRAGHEPDAFAVKPIFSIPLAVVVTFVIAFAVTTVIFFTIFRYPPENPMAHPEAKGRSSAPLNERLSRIDREGADANDKREVDQPRLEPLRRLENNGQTITQAPEPRGNSPWLHAEDIRPDRVEGLHQYGHVGKDKKVARIPIDEAMRIATEKGSTVLPAAKDGARPLRNDQLPNAANAGHGKMPAPPKKAEEPKKAPEPPKKEEPKKEEPKKGPEPPKKPEDPKKGPEPPKPPEKK